MVRRHLGQYSGSNFISLIQLPITLIGMPKKPQDPKPPAKPPRKSKDKSDDPRPPSASKPTDKESNDPK